MATQHQFNSYMNLLCIFDQKEQQIYETVYSSLASVHIVFSLFLIYKAKIKYNMMTL